MYVYAAKLSEENNAVYIGWSVNLDAIERTLLGIERRIGQKPVLLDHYTDKINGDISAYMLLFAIQLRKLGFRVIDKFEAVSSRSLYVIYVNNPDAKLLYVGKTGYPIEVRFLQHKNYVLSDKEIELSARMFRNDNNTPHSIAYDLILDRNIYINDSEAAEAEAALARNLRTMGYEVHSS